jgi:hypothetical protein
MPNYIDYQQSISNELIALKNRVRNLIGDANWGEDGRYKESILSDIFKRVLPTHVGVGTGFIIEGKDVTKQIDIIIYDNRIPLMFKNDNFIITTKESVYGIIEIKTKLSNADLMTAIDNSLYNATIINGNRKNRIFNGIFCYEYDSTFSKKVKSKLLSTKGMLNHLSLGEEKFIRFWKSETPKPLYKNDHYGVYSMHNLSFGYFISNLVAHVYEKDDKKAIKNNEFYKHLFPIQGTKEICRNDTWYIS